MTTPARSWGSKILRRPTIAARQAHASASAGWHSRGMVTVTHPRPRRSPAASGEVQTTAAPPATA
eukprot:7500035-Alexandrium_andersonii.AAC.1